eukprot:3941604-Rhodomonas_salina.2
MAEAKFKEALSLVEGSKWAAEERNQPPEYVWHSADALVASIHERLGSVLARLGAYDAALEHSDRAMRILRALSLTKRTRSSELAAREVTDEDGWNAYRLACGEESLGVVLYR